VAILRTTKHPYDTHAVFEDPVTGSNKIYFQHDAFNKETLTALIDIGVNHNAAGNAISPFGTSRFQTSSISGGLLLDGPVVWVSHETIGLINDVRLNIDPVIFLSMDPARPIRQVRYDTDGVNFAAWVQYSRHEQNFETYFNHRLNPVTDCSDTNPTINTNSGVHNGIWPVYLNPTTKNLVFLWQNHSGNNYTPAWSYGWRYTGYFTRSIAPSQTTSGQNRTNQFLGVSSFDGRAIFFQTELATDYQHTIAKYNDSDNTATVLMSTGNYPVPPAGGTSAGGNRGTNFGSNTPKFASTTFDDPLSLGNTAFYAPYFDVNGAFHPIYHRWNRTEDTFTRLTNISVNWGSTNQNAVWQPDTQSASSASVLHGLQKLFYNETFTITSDGLTTRYLVLFQLHGSGSLHDSEPRRRTFVTFVINPADPTSLTYHSHVTIPITPKNIIWLNDAKTLMGVFTHNNFYTYSFNPSTGWSLTATLPHQFWEVGKDSLGRIWALETGSNGWYNIHLITLNVPVNITVTVPQTTFNFTGTPISSNLTVNAYNPQGERIAADVKLVIDGGSMTFAGANLTTTTTTSTTEDTVVPITITGGGISNIVASVVL
jgi:hypothetical protein